MLQITLNWQDLSFNCVCVFYFSAALVLSPLVLLGFFFLFFCAVCVYAMASSDSDHDDTVSGPSDTVHDDTPPVYTAPNDTVFVDTALIYTDPEALL